MVVQRIIYLFNFLVLCIACVLPYLIRCSSSQWVLVTKKHDNERKLKTVINQGTKKRQTNMGPQSRTFATDSEFSSSEEPHVRRAGCKCSPIATVFLIALPVLALIGGVIVLGVVLSQSDAVVGSGTEPVGGGSSPGTTSPHGTTTSGSSTSVSADPYVKPADNELKNHVYIEDVPSML